MSNSVFEIAQESARRLRSVYTEYAKGPVDEGMRQFLRSMAEQEASHLRFLQEKLSSLSHDAELKAKAEDVSASMNELPPEKEVKSLSRIDFFAHVLELEEWTMKMYRHISESCGERNEMADFFHSLYEEERRHHSLVKDRYELESLL